MDIAYNILAFIFVIMTIVFVHEFGHYIVARLCNVKIEIFSIGFGKEIIGWYDKHGTRWKICFIPMGGYVKMFGDANAASQPDLDLIKNLSYEEKKISFYEKHLWQKFCIVLAGPAANYILAIFILTLMFWYYGVQYASSQIDFVNKNSPAENVGILPGDTIIEIDNLTIDKFADIEKIIATNVGDPLNIIIDRDGDLVDFEVIPELIDVDDQFGSKIKIRRLGIGSALKKHEDQSILNAFIFSTNEVISISFSMLKTVGQMIIGKRGTDDLGGPITIAKYSAASAKKGVSALLWFIALLSINLGMINLFPIPLLDGGHLLFYLIEAISGKALAIKLQEYGSRVGMVFIILLTIFSTVNDLRKINFF